MPQIQTKFFGDLEYGPDSLYQFRSGLPGFEDQRAFVFLNLPHRMPLLFMQSVFNRSLCFVLLPVLVADPTYRLTLAPEELIALDIPVHAKPKLGQDLLCATMLCGGRSGPTANLLAPIVVNLRRRLGIQVIQVESGYSHEHMLLREDAQTTC